MKVGKNWSHVRLVACGLAKLDFWMLGGDSFGALAVSVACRKNQVAFLLYQIIDGVVAIAFKDVVFCDCLNFFL